MTKSSFGMIGLGTMGRNFLLNVAEHGFSSVGYDLDEGKRQLLDEEGADYKVESAVTLPEFVEKLETPRKIMLLVPAGKIVDAVIDDLLPHLEAGDLIIDGGNSHFSDTERRETMLKEKGFRFLGVGVSGGEEGARHGASIMIGGDEDSYALVKPMLEAASAKVDEEPCAAHVGKGSAGHFVKMVHNGIEYGLMQLISEIYDILKRGFGLDNAEISNVFSSWNQTELNCFLLEITAQVLKKKDEKTGNSLVEMILDTAGQKGTGKWTSEVAMDFGVPIPTIDSAVTMRQISAMKKERLMAYQNLNTISIAVEDFRGLMSLEKVRCGLYSAFIITYAQGLALLRTASIEKGYDLNLSKICKIWRGGCIIRAGLLEEIRRAYAEFKDLSNLLLDDEFAFILRENWADLLAINTTAPCIGLPTMCLSASLNYFQAYRTSRLPANLLQAQRDFFGAHTYQRIDREGIFHTPDWDK